MTRYITDRCMICDSDETRPIPHVLVFDPLYDGICAACWRDSVRDGIHDADVLIGLGIPQEET